MYEDSQPDLPLRTTSTASGKLAHRTVLLEIGKAQFHRLTSESVEREVMRNFRQFLADEQGGFGPSFPVG
jgi:hypothetical protein